MRYLDVCAGISASTVAWKPLGWTAAAYSEIEAAPRAILCERQGAVPADWDHRHAPGANATPLFGDFTQIEAHHVGPIDLLVGGTPCQDFSVAGLRKGLAGDRGNLTLEFLRLADRTRPRWVVWENVPGVLSIDSGRAFGAFLGGLGELGYGFAYRVLDAQFFGVPQRRRRVFVVGCAGDWRRGAAVLFERHSLSGHPAPRREAGQNPASGSAWGIDSDCLDRSGEGAAGTAAQRSGLGIVEQASPALRAKRPNAVAFGGGNTAGSVDVAACPVAKGQKCDFEVETFIAHSLRGEGFDASEDGTGRGVPLVPVPFDTTQITSAANYSNPKPGDPCHPLTAGMHPPAIAFNSREDPSHSGDVFGALGSSSPQAQAVAFDLRNGTADETAMSVQAGGMGDDRGLCPNAIPHTLSRSTVRRLTPRECERLQGFPDDYTLVPYRKGMMADGPRYKALGNSMAVPVMRWIGERIAAVEALRLDRSAAA